MKLGLCDQSYRRGFLGPVLVLTLPGHQRHSLGTQSWDGQGPWATTPSLHPRCCLFHSLPLFKVVG